jgi:hypothetical protein
MGIHNVIKKESVDGVLAQKDKAEMAWQGRPALARSESRDVGHAGGWGKPPGPINF